MNTQLQYIGESILEQFQYAQSMSIRNKALTKDELSRLTDLVESFTVLAKTENDPELIEEAESYSSITRKIIMQNSPQRLNEYGFFNPFDNIDDNTVQGMNVAAADYDEPDDKNHDLRILKVQLHNSDVDNKVMFENGKMIAKMNFTKGDIIEKCPVKFIRSSSLYSKEIRDFAFPIDTEKGIWAIPFGLGTFYRNSKEFGVEGNATYEFVPNPQYPYIIIVATQKIRKGHEIVLTSTEEDFGNELVPGQFVYKQGPETYYAVKNFKVV